MVVGSKSGVWQGSGDACGIRFQAVNTTVIEVIVAATVPKIDDISIVIIAVILGPCTANPVSIHSSTFFSYSIFSVYLKSYKVLYPMQSDYHFKLLTISSVQM